MSSGSVNTNSEDNIFAISAPFINDPDADVVLQSCDDFKFQVRKAILSVASPFFNDMFSLPQPAGTDKSENNHLRTTNGLPSIRVSETGRVIDALLRFCYPVVNPCLENVDLVISVHSAAEKYYMTSIISNLEQLIKPLRLEQPKYLLLLYKTACYHRRESEAREHALECLKLPAQSIAKSWPLPVLDSSLSNLIEYHLAVSIRLGEYFSYWSNIEDVFEIILCACPTCNTPQNSLRPKWWQENLTMVLLNLTEKGLLSTNILPPTNTFESNPLCGNCALHTLHQWEALSEKIATTVKEQAEMIELVLPWHSLE